MKLSLWPAKVGPQVELRVPNSNVDSQSIVFAPFQANSDYFQVRINEMFLSSKGGWFAQYVPVVTTISEFCYDGDEHVAPFVVGPAMMERFGKKIAEGTSYYNTRVAGLHPYRGGRISLAVALCKMQVDSPAGKLVSFIESLGEALDFATSMGSLLRISKVLLEGFKMLHADSTVLLSLRREFDPAAGDEVAPGFYLLSTDESLKPEQLWVRDGRLLVGKSLAEALPYRGSDFVLYSLVKPPSPERGDLASLAFSKLWQNVQKQAAIPTDDAWTSAKASMVQLYQAILLSPDLTPGQGNKIAKQYREQLVGIRKDAQELAALDTELRGENDLGLAEDQVKSAISILSL